MKKLLIFPLLFIGFNANARCESDVIGPKWKVGIIAAGHYSSPFYGLNPVFLPGIQVNRVVGKFELRAAVEYTKLSSARFGRPDYAWMDGFSNRAVLRLGIERSFNLCNRFAVYGAADLAAQFTRSEIETFGCFGPIGIVDSRSKGVGIIPAVGMRFKLGQRVSIFAEYRAEVFLNDVTDKIIYDGGNIDTRPVRYNSADFRFGNIGHVGVQIAF